MLPRLRLILTLPLPYGGGGDSTTPAHTSQPPSASPAATRPTPHIIFPSFDALVDEYFSRLDVQRAQKNEASTKVAALKRVDRLRESHAETLVKLGVAEADAAARGRLIEACAPAVEAASIVVRSALEHGMQWVELEAVVAAETAGGNPIAGLIRSMDLGKGMIVLALKDEEAAAAAAAAIDPSTSTPVTARGGGVGGGVGAAATSAAPPAPARVVAAPKGKKAAAAAAAAAAATLAPFTSLVDIDVFSSAAANARRYYERAKAAREKGARAAASTDMALRKAERAAAETAAKQLAAASAARNIGLARKHAWFERFQ